MGRRFNKKTAQKFSVVHRAHDDAHYYDNEVSEHVLVPLKGGNTARANPVVTLTQKKVFNSSDLAEDVKLRANEGLAAQYGIYYDDSKYDYMQHLRPIGDGEGVYIEKTANVPTASKNKNIEQLFGDQVPSTNKRNVNFDETENVPAELKKFNPNMDPRLREVIEALDDEEYLERRKGENDVEIEGYEDDDDDLFQDLLKSGEVEDEDEFYYGSDADQYYEDYDEDYDEWDLDNYEEEYDAKYNSDNHEESDLHDYGKPYNAGEAPAEAKVSFANANTNWGLVLKFKADNKKKQNDWDSDNEFDEEEEAGDVLPELPPLGGASALASAKKGKSKGKLRKKKGAMSDTSAFSMSSSALFRTEGLTLLDDKYEQLAKKFENDDDEEPEYQEFDMSLERQDLEGLLDDFLDNYELEKGGRRLVKKDEDRHRIQAAADSVSRGKVAAKRKKEQELRGLGNSFSGLSL